MGEKRRVLAGSERALTFTRSSQVGIGGSENFYSVFESELADHIPVVHASIAGCRIVGRLCVGEGPLCSAAAAVLLWKKEGR